jgi:hypothetical protein
MITPFMPVPAMTRRCRVNSSGLSGTPSMGPGRSIRDHAISSNFPCVLEAARGLGWELRVGEADFFSISTTEYHFVPRLEGIATVRKPNLHLAFVQDARDAGGLGTSKGKKGRLSGARITPVRSADAQP